MVLVNNSNNPKIFFVKTIYILYHRITIKQLHNYYKPVAFDLLVQRVDKEYHVYIIPFKSSYVWLKL